MEDGPMKQEFDKLIDDLTGDLTMSDLQSALQRTMRGIAERAFRRGWMRGAEFSRSVEKKESKPEDLLNEEERDLIAGGQWIEAIKSLRYRAGISLIMARDIVHNFRDKRKGGGDDCGASV